MVGNKPRLFAVGGVAGLLVLLVPLVVFCLVVLGVLLYDDLRCQVLLNPAAMVKNKPLHKTRTNQVQHLRSAPPKVLPVAPLQDSQNV